MAVRTLEIAHGLIASTAAQWVFTVPVGKTLIVKDIVLGNFTGGVMDAFLLWNDGVDVGLLRTFAGVPNLGSGVATSAFIVLEPGAQLGVQALTQPYSYWLSGSLLAGVA